MKEETGVKGRDTEIETRKHAKMIGYKLKVVDRRCATMLDNLVTNYLSWISGDIKQWQNTHKSCEATTLAIRTNIMQQIM